MIIGIDLGTTNSTVALVEEEEIRSLPLSQVSAPGEQKEQQALASFLYFATEQEKEKQLCGVEWDPARAYCVGEYAKVRAAEAPGRVIASAKSWLSHAGVDRRELKLPLDGEEGMSPIEASAAYLRHIREAWESQYSDLSFGEQTVLITVPASFDPSARQLVQEAAELAGYPDAILLEEPQAAFYAWLHDHENWREQLSVGDKVLVVDVGGGTCDFSLIGVDEVDGNLELNRISVGQHLLLGGDNLDLALAHLAKQKLQKEGQAIDAWQMRSLTHECRRAKEELLSEKPPKKVTLTIAGRGSGLMAGSLSVDIEQAEAAELLVNGFAPLVEIDERCSEQAQSGLATVALPYAQDPRITVQLAHFLKKSGQEGFVAPTAILFNGGTMKAAALQARLVEQVEKWTGQKISVLGEANLDQAVSRGAVSYGLAREGKSIRIRGGTAHSYFIGVEQAAPAVPGLEPEVHALCVAPYGMEEGTEELLETQEFALAVGDQVAFRFFQRENPTEETAGSVVLDAKELVELSTIETVLDREGEEGKTVRVILKSKVTELGTLEIWCIAKDDPKKEWKLEFDLRAAQPA